MIKYNIYLYEIYKILMNILIYINEMLFIDYNYKTEC